MFPLAVAAAVPQPVRRAVRWIHDHPQWVVAVLYCGLLLLGWVLRGDFGLSMDESPLLAFGVQAWQYLFKGGPIPAAADWKFHSPLLQMAVVGLIILLKLNDASLLPAKHFFSFVIFSIGWLSFLGLARRLLGGWWWALLGGLWLVLTPRVFAHAFYNPKDIPGLAFFTLSVLLLVRLHERPSALRVVLFGLAAGFTISLRPFALLLPCFAVLLLGYETLRNRGRARRRWLLVLGCTLAAVAALTVAVWPLLWHDPLRNFLGALGDNVSRGDGGFYLGNLPYAAGAHPWHYLFVWMGVTVPVAYSVLFLAGAAVTLARVIRRPLALLAKSPVAAIAFLWVVLPVAARLLGRMGIFDEWRHVLFIYPAFLLLALFGFRWILETLPRHWMRTAVIVFLILNMSSTSLWMIRNHPFQYLYFTMPAGWAYRNMELDYWGLSYQEGIRWILANTEAPVVSVYLRDTNAVVTCAALSPEEQSRLSVAKSPATADYILDTLRWSAYEHVVPADRVVNFLSVDGNPFLWIYKGPFTTDKFPVYDWCEFCSD